LSLSFSSSHFLHFCVDELNIIEVKMKLRQDFLNEVDKKIAIAFFD
jgi:hypothetical protein